jgi:prepilin-type N-terminal cleavage/methylation domain-containing protein
MTHRDAASEPRAAPDLGFSLIEVLVAMMIAAAVLTALGTLLSLAAQQKARLGAAVDDTDEAIAFTRLVDRLFGDIGERPDAVAIEDQSLSVSGFGLPQSLAASGEVVAHLAPRPSGPTLSRVLFTVSLPEAALATPGTERTDTVLSDLVQYSVFAQRNGQWSAAWPSSAGPPARVRFVWQRQGGRPRSHEAVVRQGVATACIRSLVAQGCAEHLP